jgi:Kef-type K+ transport system membrane component KefB
MNVQSTEDAVAATLLELVIIIVAARLAGSAARGVRQPRVVGEIVAGLMLGPSLFGAFLPGTWKFVFNPIVAQPMSIMSQIGLILLMFQIGSGFEFGHLKDAQNRRAALLIALASITTPLCAGLVLGWQSAPVLAPNVDPTGFTLFLAVALAITAVPVLGRILREYGLARHETGVIAIAAAAVNDVVGWLLLAGIAAYATAQFSPAHSLYQIAGLLVLLAVLVLFGRPFIAWLLRRFPDEDGQLSPSLIAIVFALCFACGLATEKLGIFTIFGGFLFGLLFHPHKAFVAGWERQVSPFVLVFFLPIFFTFTGLRTNIAGLTSVNDWVWCLGIIAVASIAKIIPVYCAARIAGLAESQARTLGVLMNTRGLMELIVLNVGFSLGFLPQRLFTMLVLMAVVTTIMTGPLVRWLLARSGHRLDVLLEA